MAKIGLNYGIYKALTHSDTITTKTYVNTKDTVNQTVGDIAFRSLKKWWGEFWGELLILDKKDIQEKILECSFFV